MRRAPSSEVHSGRKHSRRGILAKHWLRLLQGVHNITKLTKKCQYRDIDISISRYRKYRDIDISISRYRKYRDGLTARTPWIPYHVTSDDIHIHKNFQINIQVSSSQYFCRHDFVWHMWTKLKACLLPLVSIHSYLGPSLKHTECCLCNAAAKLLYDDDEDWYACMHAII
jgi:hypothetical protein